MNFKNHFREAQNELQETNELTLQEAGYGTANLVDEIVQHTVHEITNELAHRANLTTETPTPAPTTPAPAPSVPQANSAVSQSRETLIQQLLQQNQNLMRQLLSANNSCCSRNSRRYRPSTSLNTPQVLSFFRTYFFVIGKKKRQFIQFLAFY